MSTQEVPVTSRISTPQKHGRSGTRGRWQPNGWDRSGGGSSGSTAAQSVALSSSASVSSFFSRVFSVSSRRSGLPRRPSCPRTGSASGSSCSGDAEVDLT